MRPNFVRVVSRNCSKAIAYVSGTLIFWIGFILCNTYLLIVFIMCLLLWQQEYFSLTASLLIAIGAWIILRIASGFIVLAGIALKGFGEDE